MVKKSLSSFSWTTPLLPRQYWAHHCGFDHSVSQFEQRPSQDSQNDASLLPLVVPLFAHEGQSLFGGFFENVLHVLLILSRTLQIQVCIHLLPGLFALWSQRNQLGWLHFFVVGTGCGFSSRCAHFLTHWPLFRCAYSLSYLRVCYGVLIEGLEPSCALFILSEVSLTANQDDRNLPAEVPHLWEPLKEEKQFTITIIFPSR